MNLKTIDKSINILTLSINEIDELIEEITYKKYLDNERGKLETSTQYNNRIQWIINSFPTHKKLSEITGSKVIYITNTATRVKWTIIKEDLQLLYNRKEELEKKEKQEKANKIHLEIWEHNEDSIKFDLNYIANEKNLILKKLQGHINEKRKHELKMELHGLSVWESELRKDFKIVQASHRTALGQTNNYKDTTPDKLELEQKGELNLNQKIENSETEEERMEKYASYFKRINSKATSKDNGNSTGK